LGFVCLANWSGNFFNRSPPPPPITLKFGGRKIRERESRKREREREREREIESEIVGERGVFLVVVGCYYISFLLFICVYLLCVLYYHYSFCIIIIIIIIINYT